MEKLLGRRTSKGYFGIFFNKRVHLSIIVTIFFSLFLVACENDDGHINGSSELATNTTITEPINNPSENTEAAETTTGNQPINNETDNAPVADTPSDNQPGNDQTNNAPVADAPPDSQPTGDQANNAPVATTGEACIMWSYDTSTAPNLAGFRIYDGDGNLLHETTNMGSMHVDFQVNMTGEQMTFTMTAFDTEGNESAHSIPVTATRSSAASGSA